MSRIVYKICGCGVGYYPEQSYHTCTISKMFKRSAQLPPSERPVVWERPDTKEIRYPGHTGEMPDYYKALGYERKEFTSYHEHKQFCDEQGMVNHKVEGIRDEALEN